MKQTQKTSICGISAALAVVLMLLGYFPYFTYAAPAVAGVCMMIPVMEVNLRWAWGTYAVSALLIFLFCEREAALLYLFLLGYYPIMKAVIERIGKLWLEWLCKISVFAASVGACYAVLAFVFDFNLGEFGNFEKYGSILFLVLATVTFVLYDIGLSRLSGVYALRFHRIFKKTFRL
ncbi:MAG: hypothetical protein IKI29_00970 [Clostridia bacterium]|nr:hypothetical protein [Clostridia bacterium]